MIAVLLEKYYSLVERNNIVVYNTYMSTSFGEEESMSMFNMSSMPCHIANEANTL